MSDEGRVDQNDAMSDEAAQEGAAPGAKPPLPVLGDGDDGLSASSTNALNAMPDLSDDGPGEEPTAKLESPSDASAQAGGTSLLEDDPEMRAAAAALEERHARDRRARTIRIGIGAAALVAIVVAIVVSNVLGKGASSTSIQSETVVVERGDLVGDVNASAKIAPARNVDIVAEVAGTVQEVKATEGQHVEAGDELFVLKSDDVARSLASAGTALERAQNDVNDANRSVSNAQRDYDQAVSDYNAEVAARNDAISQAEREADEAYQQTYNELVAEIPASASTAERNSLLAQAQNDAQEAYNDAYSSVYIPDPGTFDHTTFTDAINVAQSSARDVSLSLTEAQRDYDAALAESNKLVVRAPVAGTVTSVTTKVGASVGGLVGSGALCQVVDTNSLCVDVEVGEADVASIKNGQNVTVTLPSLPGVTLEGKVTKVATTSTALSASESAVAVASDPVTYKVETTITKGDERVKPGMSVDLSIKTQDVPNTLLVPVSSVFAEGGNAYVIVAPNSGKGALERRAVVVAGRSSTQCAISQGLSEGELVLVSPIDESSESTSTSVTTSTTTTTTQEDTTQDGAASQGAASGASTTTSSTATGTTTKGKAS